MLGHLMWLTLLRGKPRGKVLCEDVWDTVRWTVRKGDLASNGEWG